MADSRQERIAELAKPVVIPEFYILWVEHMDIDVLHKKVKYTSNSAFHKVCKWLNSNHYNIFTDAYKPVAFTIYYRDLHTNKNSSVEIHCEAGSNLGGCVETACDARIKIDIKILKIAHKNFCNGCFHEECSQRYHECLGFNT